MSLQDIAIIGLAGRFPGGHEDIHSFRRALENGEDCVLPISKQRVMESTLPLEELDFQVMGALSEVDKFDHAFFNISQREAENMDPHQRLMMEIAYSTFESAGQRLEDVAGTKTGVIVANADYEYWHKFEQYEGTMFTGNTPFSVAGRIARFFKLHGPDFLVDTGCSATLMGVRLGCGELQLGNATQMLVVGCRIILSPQKTVLSLDVGASSFDGKTRSFTEGSRGSGSSEMLGAALIKPLEQALADGDPIYAVIKAAHSNTSAERSASLTATSSAAETELLLEAWAKAGVDPRTIGCIEAHGSGTQLGDPIEISAIDAAFRKFSSDKHFCAVTCVKTNIGHTDKLAGMAGLIKSVQMLRYKRLYPLIHFTQPSSFIDFENSATYINTENRPWEAPVRRVGVSSFGFAGNNVHVLLEEAPELPERTDPPLPAYGVWVSGKTKAAAQRNLIALRDYLREEPQPLQDIAYTSTCGRSHFRHRFAFLASSAEELIGEMESRIAINAAPIAADTPRNTYLLLSGEEASPAHTLALLHNQYPDFTVAHTLDPRVARVEELISLYELLKAAGVPAQNLLGFGLGEIAVNIITGVQSKADALASLAKQPAPDLAALPQRLERFVDRETEHGRIVFVELGTGTPLGNTLRRLPIHDREERYGIASLDLQQPSPLTALAKALFEQAVPLDGARYSRLHPGRKIWLPPYQFEKVRCWAEPAYTEAQYAAWQAQIKTPEQMGLGLAYDYDTQDIAAETATFEPNPDWTATEQEVGRIWAFLLRSNNIGLDDDFFSLGGHSLLGTMMINRIEKLFAVRLMFKDILAYSSIRRLSAGIDAIRSGERKDEFQPITRIPDAADYALSHAQKRLWILWNLDPGNLAYNLPETFPLDADLDIPTLERAFQTLIARHESLRTTFKVQGEEARQVVHPSLDFRLEVEDLGDGPQAEAALAQAQAREFGHAFDLTRGPLLRARLLRMGKDGYRLLLLMHHIVSDAWSMQVLLNEMRALYDAFKAGKPADLPELPIHYRDFAHWQNEFLASEAGARLREYWNEKFKQPIPHLELPYDFPRGAVPTYAGHAAEFWLNTARTAALRGIAKAQGATLYMISLAAFNFLLRKYAPSNALVVGTPMAGRSHNDLEEQIGFYVNTLPILSEIQPEDSFVSLLARTKQNIVEDMERQDYPMDKLVQEVVTARDMSRNPLFDVFFALLVPGTVGAQQEAEAHGENIQPIPYPTSKFDLEMQAYDHGQTLRFSLGYKTDLFRWETVQTLCEQYIGMVDAIIQNPEICLSDLKLMGATARVVVTDTIRKQQSDLEDLEFDI